MHPVLLIVFMFIGGFGAQAIARSKNRDSAGWFVFGLFLPLIALISATCVSTLPAPEQRL